MRKKRRRRRTPHPPTNIFDDTLPSKLVANFVASTSGRGGPGWRACSYTNNGSDGLATSGGPSGNAMVRKEAKADGANDSVVLSDPQEEEEDFQSSLNVFDKQPPVASWWCHQLCVGGQKRLL